MTLHLYIARRFLWSFLLVAGVMAMVFLLLDVVEHIRTFDSNTVGMIAIVQLSLLNLPTWIAKTLPLLVILATVTMFLGLARSSEMVVTRASGRSALVTLSAPIITIFLIGLLALAAFNPIVAATSKQYQLLSSHLRSASTSVMSLSPEGLWLRQGNRAGQTVIHAQRSELEGTQLYGVTFFSFDTDGAVISRVDAASARLEPGRWSLTQAKVWTLSNTSNPEKSAVERKVYWISSNLTQKQIQDSFGAPSSIQIWELPGFIDQLEEAGFSSRQHRVWFQMELATPLSLIAMLLIGAGFTMRHTRFGRTGLMVLLALMFGFGIYFIRNFAQILGENGQIPVLVAAWTPPVAAVLLSLGILLHLEDG